MGRLEVACRKFAVLSGIAQDPANYITCLQPHGQEGARKGLLALVAEPAGDHPALAGDASRLARDLIVRHYYADNSFSLTSSLLKALDSANGALLHHNYNNGGGEQPASESHGGTGLVTVAVQAGGVRTRRAQVGLTSVLLKPDGAGVYIGQMSPTQAYIVHNGLVSALPEPASWRERPGKISVLLHPVLDLNEGAIQEAPGEEGPLPDVPLPALPLGSGPGVEVDLIYRRVEPGDFIIVVSTSLARYLDRPLAEQLFASGDADTITHSLYTLASERGLAQCHACVLELGVEQTSGVDAGYAVQVTSPVEEPPALNGSARLPDEEAEEQPPQPMLLNVLKGPKQWFSRQRPPAEDADEPPDALIEHEQAYEQPDGEAFDQAQTADPAEDPSSRLPTQVLLQHALDVPPYKVTSAHQEMEQDELEFDGWEDVPPALGDQPDGYLEQSPQGRQSERGFDTQPWVDSRQAEQDPQANDGYPRPKLYQVPILFDEEEWLNGELQQPSASPEAAAGNRPREVGQRAVSWTADILKSLLPDNRVSQPQTEAQSKRPLLVPARVAIALGIVIVLGALALSLSSVSGRANQTAINNHLADAREENTLGNQQDLPAEERRTHLLKALDLAKQAQQLDPDSEAPQLLIADTQVALDALDGITRVAPKLLFDLSGGATAATAPASTAPVQLTSIEVQGNEAFVLDRQGGRIYSCLISSKECALALQSGDTTGDQKVGPLVDMTLRIGSLVAVDQSFVSYIHNAETSSWEAQPLGASEAMQELKDIASYDGNLYLLGARQGQITKYFSGRYGEPPDDWLKDPPSSEQIQNPVAMGIDGSIFVLLGDGRILVMQAGKVANTLTPKAGNDGAPFTGLFTSTETQDLYLFRASDGAILRATKEGEVRATYKVRDGGVSGPVTGFTVDEGRGKLFLLEGGRVYEASLNPRKAVAPSEPAQESAPIGNSEPEASATAIP